MVRKLPGKEPLWQPLSAAHRLMLQSLRKQQRGDRDSELMESRRGRDFRAPVCSCLRIARASARWQATLPALVASGTCGML